MIVKNEKVGKDKVKESHFLQMPNNSDNNLSEYLNQKLDALLALRAPNAGESYKPEDIADSMELFRLYINAKTESRDGIHISEYSKKSFEELILRWEVLKPEFKAIILEDCFTNANDASEQFLFMRDKHIGKKGESFFHCDSSRYREHLILSNEIDDQVVKGYCAIRRLKQIGISDEGVENLIRRDMAINKNKTYINRNLPESEKKKRSEKAYINSLFRIASNCDALLDLVNQEEGLAENQRYFDREAVISNIKEAASDAPFVKSLLSTSIEQLVSRANFIKWQDNQTVSGGALEGERLLFNNKGLFSMLTMPNVTFSRLFDYELQLAEELSYYKLDDGLRLNFRNIYNANLALCNNYEERIKLNKEFPSVFLSYDFGSPNDYCEQKVEEYYEKAYSYYKDLEGELKRGRREEERKERAIFDTSDRNNNDEPKIHHERDKDNTKPRTFDEDRIDDSIEKATKLGLKFVKPVAVPGIGTPDVGNPSVIYYVFKKEDPDLQDIYIWEPMGQPGNATLIFKTQKDLDEFVRGLIEENKDNEKHHEERLSIDKLVREKRVYRMGHSEGLTYNVNKLVAIFETIKTADKEVSLTASLRNLKLDELEKEHISLIEEQSRATERNSISEVPKMVEFIEYFVGEKEVDSNKSKKVKSKKKEKIEDVEKKMGAKVNTFRKLRDNIKEIHSDREE